MQPLISTIAGTAVIVLGPLGAGARFPSRGKEAATGCTSCAQRYADA